MKKLFLFLLLICGLAVGAGFYLDWFSFSSKTEGNQKNISVTMDQDKVKEDTDKLKDKAKELTGKIQKETKTAGSSVK